MLSNAELIAHAKADISNSGPWLTLLCERIEYLQAELDEARAQLGRTCEEAACGECPGCLAAQAYFEGQRTPRSSMDSSTSTTSRSSAGLASVSMGNS